MQQRENLASRLGFILISAGCAIGLGNVWRFPYIVGQYGGALFVLIYLFFLVILGIPVMSMEFSVGRASRRSIASSFHVLEPKGSKWHVFGSLGFSGNLMLLMFYTTIAGWMLIYFVKSASGAFAGMDAAAVGGVFEALTLNPALMTVGMVASVAIGMAVCGMGLQNGVERITKWMMLALLAIMVILAARSVTLPGAAEGLRFYLMPNLSVFERYSVHEVVFAAMGQSFFTLSLGIGSMAIFGSYIGKERRLVGEAVNITLLDTFVAITAGLIIFPACAAYGVAADSGPGLIFVTLPNVFNNMAGGRLWGSLFFVFLSFAALSTVIAVFENIVAGAMEKWNWSRKRAVLVCGVVLMVLSLPCILGFNVLSGFQPIGEGSGVLDLEDFIVSNNLLPLGSLIYVLFCVSPWGWGWKNYLAEANTGKGIVMPRQLRIYLTYILPLIILYIFVSGYIGIFGGSS